MESTLSTVKTSTKVSINPFLAKYAYMYVYVITCVERFKYIFCRGGVGIKKRNNLVSKNTGKSRTAIKEPKLLISHQPNRYVFQQTILIDNYCIKSVNRNKLMLQDPGSSFISWFIAFTVSKNWSLDRNHSSNATGDISVTTRSEETKRCSFNAYL